MSYWFQTTRGAGMALIRTATAGYPASGDCLVTISPNNGLGVLVELSGKPLILKQFGRQIRDVIVKTVEELSLNDITVTVKDNGALDCTIKARVKCAAARASVGE